MKVKCKKKKKTVVFLNPQNGVVCQSTCRKIAKIVLHFFKYRNMSFSIFYYDKQNINTSKLVFIYNEDFKLFIDN